MKRFRLSIINQFFLYIFFIFFIFTGIVIYIQYNREKEFKEEKLDSRLSIYNYSIDNLIKEKGVNKEEIQHFIKLIPDSLIRISVFDSLGNVLFDSEFENVSILGNHSNRPEFIEAQKNGKGKSIHKSSIKDKQYYYLLQSFGHYNVRTALPYDIQIIEMLKAGDKQFIYYLIIIFLVVLFCIWFVSHTLNKVFIQLRNIAQKVENDEPFEDNTLFRVSELNEVGNYISNTYNKLWKVRDELVSEKEKLFKHLQISQEGLAIFSENRKSLIVNELFIQYINMISASPIQAPEDIFGINEFSALAEFLQHDIDEDSIAHEILSENFKIESNGYTFMVKCILFEDRSFEVSINNITQLEKQSLLKKELTENIAHELRTPVSSISGYLETIIQNPEMDDKRLQLFIERCYAQSIRLAHLVNDISLLNKIDSETDFFERESLVLNDIIKNVFQDSLLQIEEKKNQVSLSLPDNLRVTGNRSLLYSIFRNLLDNTLSYAGDKVTIGLHCYREDENAYYFSYYDTGVGIPQQHLSRIFDRFYRIDRGRSRKVGGTGLGLAIVKNAILFHGGIILAKSRAEGGIEFLFTLTKE